MRAFEAISTLGLSLGVAAAAYGQTELIELDPLVGGTGPEVFAIDSTGQIIAGTCDSPRPTPFFWTALGGKVSMGLPAGAFTAVPNAISNDGGTIVGNYSMAFAWSQQGGYQSLGVLPGFHSSSATDVNEDGTVVVGYASSEESLAAFRWTAEGGMVNLGAISPGDEVQAFGVSADGSVVVGLSQDQGFRWTASEGMVGLGMVPGLTSGMPAVGVSDDGRTLAMRWRFRWTVEGGYEAIELAEGSDNNEIRAISGDGTTLVGINRYPGPTSARALYWRSELGTLDLLAYLDELGVDTTGWALREAIGVSADGGSVIGSGLFQGEFRSFLVRGLPVATPCRADLDGDGELTLFDFLAFQNAFASGDPIADFDGDGSLTLFDFLAFQNAFAAGCP